MLKREVVNDNQIVLLSKEIAVSESRGESHKFKLMGALART
jgi:hypothetical protein